MYHTIAFIALDCFYYWSVCLKHSSSISLADPNSLFLKALRKKIFFIAHLSKLSDYRFHFLDSDWLAVTHLFFSKKLRSVSTPLNINFSTEGQQHTSSPFFYPSLSLFEKLQTCLSILLIPGTLFFTLLSSRKIRKSLISSRTRSTDNGPVLSWLLQR